MRLHFLTDEEHSCSPHFIEAKKFLDVLTVQLGYFFKKEVGYDPKTLAWPLKFVR